VPKKKGTQPLTLIVVPHAERAPVSFCVPTWLLPLACVLCLVVLFGLGGFGLRFNRLNQELRDLRQDRQLQLAREREMRNTILVQQEQVRDLSSMVADFQMELAGVNSLSADIRDLIGLPSPTTTPAAATAAFSGAAYRSVAPDESLTASASDARGGRIVPGSSEHSMALAVEKSQDVIDMQVTLPSTFRELASLRDEVLERMEKIEPEKRTNATDLEKQLRLLAAAPHLWPTEQRRVSSKFGYRTLYGQLEFHNGIDLVIWYGKVKATKDGVVTYAGWKAGYGWVIEIENEMGFSTTYGHCSKLLVAAGDEVKAGEVIATSGNSGRSTGPHLHYEIRLNDVPVDPLKYLDADAPYVTVS
jgi:murein DD-endopeptidase MepM/ murein hydrolase activator NlpD